VLLAELWSVLGGCEVELGGLLVLGLVWVVVVLLCVVLVVALGAVVVPAAAPVVPMDVPVLLDWLVQVSEIELIEATCSEPSAACVPIIVT
jgi:hypothetical protein